MGEPSTVAITLSGESRGTAGIIFLTLVAVELGGLAVLRIVRGNQPATEFQLAFSRAGHAHAGVLLILALLAQVYADAADLDGALDTIARGGFWLAAILFPAGFFGHRQAAASLGRTGSSCWSISELFP